MLTERLIPSLLMRDGRLVKGARYADHRDAGLPTTTARAHNAQGADEMILIDIDASRQHRPPDLDTVAQVADECFMPLTVGGGITSPEIAHTCMAAGADKLLLTTTALDNPDLLATLAHTFGAQALVIGIDVIWGDDASPRLYDHRTGSTVEGRDPLAWACECVERGAGEIRLMAVDREGSRQGYDLDLLRAFRSALNVPLIVEGGAGTLDHLLEGLEAGADAVATGTMLVFSDNNLVKLQRFLGSHGRPVRG